MDIIIGSWEKRKWNTQCSFKNYSSRLERAVSTIRAGRAGTVEEIFVWETTKNYLSTSTRVEFLFRLLLSIGVLFRVGTPYSSIPFRITFRSCQGETQKHGSTCLLRITMGMQIRSLEKFIPKGIMFELGSSKCSDWFKLHRIAEDLYTV